MKIYFYSVIAATVITAGTARAQETDAQAPQTIILTQDAGPLERQLLQMQLQGAQNQLKDAQISAKLVEDLNNSGLVKTCEEQSSAFACDQAVNSMSKSMQIIIDHFPRAEDFTISRENALVKSTRFTNPDDLAAFNDVVRYVNFRKQKVLEKMRMDSAITTYLIIIADRERAESSANVSKSKQALDRFHIYLDGLVAYTTSVVANATAEVNAYQAVLQDVDKKLARK